MAAFKVKSIRIKAVILLAVLLASVAVAVGSVDVQQMTVLLEVKEPLEILASNSSLSLYPGETLNFSVTVVNQASVSYNASLTFSLNDSQYQQQYAIFSNTIYNVTPGTNILDASLYISGTAPAAELELTTGITRDLTSMPTESPNPTTIPTNSTIAFTPTETLLGAGARWAAQNGTSALYIDWFDNYNAHHFTDGANWGPYWGVNYLSAMKNATVETLQQQGFNVTCAGDVPNDLSSYSLVVFEAWFAVEPQDNQLVRNYLSNGGNVVIIGGVPCYFSTYCKDDWPYVTDGENLASLQDWFGSSLFVNTGGSAHLVVDDPFGASILAQNQLYYTTSYSCYAVTSMSSDATVIALWNDGSVFAFTHCFGTGRVYYQGAMDF
jgi:hypothetical protein